MKALILAAGYGTRLLETAKGSPHEKLINNTPKALLPLNGKPLLEYHLDQLKAISDISQVYIVANSHPSFRQAFEHWETKYNCPGFVQVFYDGSTSNDNRLGAIGDIKFVLDQIGLDDFIILAGDTLTGFEISDLVNMFKKCGDTSVAVDMKNSEKIRERYGNLKVTPEGRILEFVEKPTNPISTLAAVPFYVFGNDSLRLIDTYLAEGNNPDAPGHFLAWLIHKREVCCLIDTAKKLDIGSYEDYLAADAHLREESRRIPVLEEK